MPKYLAVVVTGLTLLIAAAILAPTRATAQTFPNCWGCQYIETAGYWTCARSVTVSGSSNPDDCHATFTYCDLYYSDCGPVEFAADGSALAQPTALPLGTGDEQVILVSGPSSAEQDSGPLLRRSACTGAIIARQVDPDAAAQARRLSQKIVI
jgi:hypothetical protein